MAKNDDIAVFAPLPYKDTNHRIKQFRASPTFGLLQVIYHGCMFEPSGLREILRRSELYPDSYFQTKQFYAAFYLVSSVMTLSCLLLDFLLHTADGWSLLISYHPLFTAYCGHQWRQE